MFNRLLRPTIFVCLVFCLAGCSSTNTSQPSEIKNTSGKTVMYSNNSYHFQVAYPDNWTTTTPKGSLSSIIVFTSPADDGTKTFQENIRIGREDVSKTPKITLDAFQDTGFKSLREQAKDAIVAEKNDLTINSLPAKEVVYKLTVGKIKGYTRQVLIRKDNFVFLITYSATQENPLLYKDIFDQIVHSFKIIN
jgi:hypothetical protein